MRFALLAAVLALFVASPEAQGFTVDQECVGEIWSQYNISHYAPAGQEFAPSDSQLNVVELWVTGQDGSADLRVRVRRGAIDGDILGESRVLPVAGSMDGIARFDFESPVSVTAGELHVLEVVHAGGSGLPLLGAVEADSYAGGRPILSGSFLTASDFWFRTGLDALTPVTPTTWGAVKAMYRGAGGASR